jgi:glutathione S-transferase
MLQLYHADMSTCSQKVRLVLAEKGVKAEEIIVDLATGAQKRPEYLKLNPGGYVPTIVHDGHAVPESTVICEYLDEAFPAPPLKPQDAAGRARMRWWTRLVDDALHRAGSAVSIVIWMRDGLLKQPKENLERSLAAMPNPGLRAWRRDLIENGVESVSFAGGLAGFISFIGDMEKALAEHPWLAGDSYSLADIGVVPYINRADELQLGSLLFAGRPHVARWLDAVRARPNYTLAVQAHSHGPVLETMAVKGMELKPRITEIMRSLNS